MSENAIPAKVTIKDLRHAERAVARARARVAKVSGQLSAAEACLAEQQSELAALAERYRTDMREEA